MRNAARPCACHSITAVSFGVAPFMRGAPTRASPSPSFHRANPCRTRISRASIAARAMNASTPTRFARLPMRSASSRDSATPTTRIAQHAPAGPSRPPSLRVPSLLHPSDCRLKIGENTGGPSGGDKLLSGVRGMPRGNRWLLDISSLPSEGSHGHLLFVPNCPQISR